MKLLLSLNSFLCFVVRYPFSFLIIGCNCRFLTASPLFCLPYKELCTLCLAKTRNKWQTTWRSMESRQAVTMPSCRQNFGHRSTRSGFQELFRSVCDVLVQELVQGFEYGEVYLRPSLHGGVLLESVTFWLHFHFPFTQKFWKWFEKQQLSKIWFLSKISTCGPVTGDLYKKVAALQT